MGRGGGGGLAQCMEGRALWAQELGVGREGRWRALRCQAGHLRDPPPAGSLRALGQVTSSSELRVCHVQSEEVGATPLGPPCPLLWGRLGSPGEQPFQR